MELYLDKKVALVTGGSHGIGQAICYELALEGCDIAFCARGERYDLEETTHLVEDLGVSCLPLKIDTSAETNARLIVQKTMDAYGRIDILINNVGGGSSWGNLEEWEKTRSSKWEEVMQHNYMTSMWFTNLVIPQMVSREWGRVISIGAVYGNERGGQPWFHAAKAAQLALMKSYSGNPNYVSKGVTFNTVCPGFTDVGHKDKQFGTELLDKVPARKFGRPSDVAPIVTFLCSEKASYINGACIMVDGGMSYSI